MLLSIIIVNYNVRYFLEFCLLSVQKALDGIEAEVFVVDNHSSDGSAEYIAQRFPWVKLIVNKHNPGFGKANNQALEAANGKYILFLNPDTIIGEDCFQKCLSFMDQHADAGALGVYMIDGSGRYLKESKRGFPSPLVAASKMSGLPNAFPNSKIFARYYLGHLNPHQTNIVDALSGAFLLARKDVLEKTGGFDERFFMYAEDIDLSYRIQKTGYNNYYFTGSPIIHFKGESTRKDIAYTKQFYKAMVQFVEKHYSGRSLGLYTGLLKLGISGKQTIDIIRQKFSRNKHESKSSEEINKRSTIYIYGDQSVSARIKPIIEQYGFTAIEDRAKADATLLCEGAQFTFGDLISYMKQNPDRRYILCSSNAGALISSNTSKTQGDMIILQERI